MAQFWQKFWPAERIQSVRRNYGVKLHKKLVTRSDRHWPMDYIIASTDDGADSDASTDDGADDMMVVTELCFTGRHVHG